MAIRAKAKAFFRRSRNKNDSDDNLSKTDSTDSHERWPSNVYKPGEPMPRPKYRQPPKKEHKEHLDSFSFADAWRRKSFQSQYSPMGTRAPSRLPSAAPSRRSSWYSRKKSMSYGRSGSVTSVDSHKSAGAVKRELSQKSRRSEIERKPSQRSAPPLSRSSSFKSPRREPNHNTTHAAVATRLSTEQEEEGDDDVFNVGMSRVQSHERYPLSRQRSLNERPPAGYVGDSLNKSMTSHHDSIQAHDHHPFTEQELALALKRSHLTVPGQA